MIVIVDALHLGRLQPLAEEVVDGPQKQRRIVREFLRRIFASARHDDGGEIARAEVLLDEIARVAPHDRRPYRRDVQVVEHDDVNAARLDVAIRSDVGGDGPAAERKRRRAAGPGSSM